MQNGTLHRNLPWQARFIAPQRFSRLRHAFSTQRFPHTPHSELFTPFVFPVASDLPPQPVSPRYRPDVRRWASPSGRGQVLMVLPDAVLEILPRPRRGITRILR